MKEILLPESVDSIGYSAFKGCRSLRSIAIPSKVKWIDRMTFNSCSQLNSVVLPDGIKVIDAWAFSTCDSLKEIVLPASVDSIGRYAFDATVIVRPQGDVPACIGEHAFANKAEVVVGVAALDAYGEAAGWRDYFVHGEPFASGHIEYMPLPEHTVVVTGNTVEEGGRLDIPGRVEHGGIGFAVGKIADGALSGLVSALSVRAEVETIGRQMFYELRDNVAYSLLESVELPRSLKCVEDSLFCGCKMLAAIEIPDGVERIGESAFADNSSLRGITIPEKVDTIKPRTFSGCYALESVALPEGLKCIGEYAFSRAEALSSIHLPESLKSIGAGAFGGTGLTEITLPYGLEAIDNMAFRGCEKLKNVYASNDNAYHDNDGVLIQSIQVGEKKDICLCYYPIGRDVSDYDVPSGVTHILPGAFYGNEKLRSVTLPEGLKHVSGFEYTGISEISLPSTVEAIGKNAFMYTRIRTISLPSALTSVGEGAFNGCPIIVIRAESTVPPYIEKYDYRTFVVCVRPEAFENYSQDKNWNIHTIITELYDDGRFAYLPCDDGTLSLLTPLADVDGNIDIPSTVTVREGSRTVSAISPNAFAAMYRLSSVSIPASVVSVGNNAFAQCALVDVSFADGSRLETIGACAFDYNPNLEAFHIPGNARLVFPNFRYSYKLEKISAEPENPWHTIDSGALYSRGMDTLQFYPVVGGSDRFVLPLTVKAVSSNDIMCNWDVKSLYVFADTPPAILSHGYKDIEHTTLYVRQTALERYRETAWGFFSNIVGLTDSEIEGIIASVESVPADSNADDSYYTIGGVRVDKPSGGLYIHGGRKVIIR